MIRCFRDADGLFVSEVEAGGVKAAVELSSLGPFRFKPLHDSPDSVFVAGELFLCCLPEQSTGLSSISEDDLLRDL